jgi:uncharacterized protein YndB with AHSA1/START domain
MKHKNKTTVIAEPGKQELFISREFEAPREVVFKAFGEADLLRQWMGPRDMEMEIEKFDNRSGGSYRFVHMDTNGNKFAFNGVVHEVAKPERTIRTFEFEGLPEKGHVSLEIATFESLSDKRTKVSIQSIFRSVEDRDGMVMSGMERGVVDSHNRLDELLEKGF